MTFYSYMIKNYKGKGGPKADLANDMYGEKGFPRVTPSTGSSGYDEILAYLDAQGACRDCIDVFNDAWAEYMEVCYSDYLRNAANTIQQYCACKSGPDPEQCASCKIRQAVGCECPWRSRVDVPLYWDLDCYGEVRDGSDID